MHFATSLTVSSNKEEFVVRNAADMGMQRRGIARRRTATKNVPRSRSIYQTKKRKKHKPALN